MAGDRGRLVPAVDESGEGERVEPATLPVVVDERKVSAKCVEVPDPLHWQGLVAERLMSSAAATPATMTSNRTASFAWAAANRARASCLRAAGRFFSLKDRGCHRDPVAVVHAHSPHRWSATAAAIG